MAPVIARHSATVYASSTTLRTLPTWNSSTARRSIARSMRYGRSDLSAITSSVICVIWPTFSSSVICARSASARASASSGARLGTLAARRKASESSTSSRTGPRSAIPVSREASGATRWTAPEARPGGTFPAADALWICAGACTAGARTESPEAGGRAGASGAATRAVPGPHPAARAAARTMRQKERRLMASRETRTGRQAERGGPEIARLAARGGLEALAPDPSRFYHAPSSENVFIAPVYALAPQASGARTPAAGRPSSPSPNSEGPCRTASTSSGPP